MFLPSDSFNLKPSLFTASAFSFLGLNSSPSSPSTMYSNFVLFSFASNSIRQMFITPLPSEVQSSPDILDPWSLAAPANEITS